MQNIIDLEILHTYTSVCKNKTAHSERRVQKLQSSQQNCTYTAKCAKIKLHIIHAVCKKIGVFMNFANNTLQMMKEMMFSRVEMMKIAKHTLQIKTKWHFTKTSSFVI